MSFYKVCESYANIEADIIMGHPGNIVTRNIIKDDLVILNKKLRYAHEAINLVYKTEQFYITST